MSLYPLLLMEHQIPKPANAKRNRQQSTNEQSSDNPLKRSKSKHS